MATTTHLVTADELWAMPDDGHRYDLIRGRLYRMSPAGGEHGGIGMEFGRLIANDVVARGLGKVFGAETGFYVARDPDTVLAPDIAFIRADRLPPPADLIRFVPIAPDLAVEIMSPWDRETEVTDKVQAYLDAGVPLVLVIRPRPRTVTLHAPGQPPRVLGEGDVLDFGDVLPGLRLAVADIFR